MDALEIVGLGRGIVVLPEAGAGVVGAGLQQANQAVAEHGFALARRHRDVALPLEEMARSRCSKAF